MPTYSEIMNAKAHDNLQAAQTLINNGLCTSSVHCSYYAVFQYMKYILAKTNRNPVSYEEQKKITNREDSHEYIVKEIKNRINNPSKARDFLQATRVLKNNRKEADYELKAFSQDESLTCIDDAKGLIMKLKTYFGNHE